MIASWQESSDKPGPCVESRDITLPKKVLGPWPSQSYGLASDHQQLWELDCKKAEHQKIDAFEQWCWRRLLSVPWMARRSNQSILREISPEYSLEELMLKLKLQYFGTLMGTANSLEKSLILGMIEDRRRRGHQRMMAEWHHWCNGHELGQTSGGGEGERGLVYCSPWGCKESDMTGRLNNYGVCIPHLYLSICRWTPRLLPCLGYSK